MEERACEDEEVEVHLTGRKTRGPEAEGPALVPALQKT